MYIYHMYVCTYIYLYVHICISMYGVCVCVHLHIGIWIDIHPCVCGCVWVWVLSGILCPWDFPGKNTGVGYYSRECSQHRDGTHISCISCIGRWILYHHTSWEAHISIYNYNYLKIYVCIYIHILVCIRIQNFLILCIVSLNSTTTCRPRKTFD